MPPSGVIVPVGTGVSVGVTTGVGDAAHTKSPSASLTMKLQFAKGTTRKLPKTMTIGVAVGVAAPPPGVNVALTVGVGVNPPPPAVKVAVGVGDAPNCAPSLNILNPANCCVRRFTQPFDTVEAAIQATTTEEFAPLSVMLIALPAVSARSFVSDAELPIVTNASPLPAKGEGVAVGVSVTVGVGVAVTVGVGVRVTVAVGVAVAVGVGIHARTSVHVKGVPVAVTVGVAVRVAVGVAVIVGVAVKVGVGVSVALVAVGIEPSVIQIASPFGPTPTATNPGVGHVRGWKHSRFTHACVWHSAAPVAPPQERFQSNTLPWKRGQSLRFGTEFGANSSLGTICCASVPNAVQSTSRRARTPGHLLGFMVSP